MILWRAGFRYLLRHPLQIIFAVVGVALGVSVVIAIDLANSSSERAFSISADALVGRTTHIVVGGARGLPESVYRDIRLTGQWRNSAPVVEGYASIASRPDLTLKLVGVDPFSESPFRNYTPNLDSQTDIVPLLTKPGAGLMTKETSDSLGIKKGDSLRMTIGNKTYDFTFTGLLETRDKVTNKALENLVIVDISSAQEMLSLEGFLSRIDLILPKNIDETKTLEKLQSLLPASAEIIPANARAKTMAQMTSAFQLNLTALSLLALVVGMFLIYNTMTFSILQRRSLLGALRTLGVTRKEIFSMVLIEALIIGAIGTLLGLALGALLANALLSIVTRTINDLYFVVNVQNLYVAPFSIAKGLLLGLGATTVAAFMPALEAAKTSPRSVLIRSNVEARQRSFLPWIVKGGLCLIALSAFGLLIPSKSIPGSFIFMFMLITGYAFITPGAFVWILKKFQPFSNRYMGILGKMAVRNLLGGLSRTGVATSALVIAVAATVGVGIMINSFRSTVDKWLQSYLQADIYVTTSSSTFGPGRTPLNKDFLRLVNNIDGIETLTKARHLSLQTEQGINELFVAEIPRKSFESYWFLDGSSEEIYQDFTSTKSVIVSEPYAYHNNLARGDSISLRTDRGEQAFRIAGVFTDYGSDRGRITMSRQLYAEYWMEDEADALGVYLETGFDADSVAKQIRLAAVGNQQVVVYSNKGLREASLETFDRTFAVTAVLRMLAVLVAFIGILNALMAMQIERSRELAILRANGLTPQQLWHLVVCETGIVGFVAGLLALPLGILQALVLILVINQRSFGWSMQISIDPIILLQALVLSLLAALLAGIYPSWRMARTSPALAMRYE
ncbi:MAG: FtsX-like permease family protein [Desulfuromonadales bacterium]|jgi:putative ABC transport system permease protein